MAHIRDMHPVFRAAVDSITYWGVSEASAENRLKPPISGVKDGSVTLRRDAPPNRLAVGCPDEPGAVCSTKHFSGTTDD